MVTVPEPQYDPRFSTQAALNRGVVAQWVRQRAGDVLDEWFAKGFPHKRLATEAMECAVEEGWIEGVEKIWQCGWVPKGALLRAGWEQYPRFRKGVWQRPANEDDTPMEAWLIEKTWGPTDGMDKEWTRGQVSARISALLYSRGDRHAWERYMGLGVNLASKAGENLQFNFVINRRFPRYMSRHDRLVEGDQRALLDHHIEQMLSLPDEQRAPVSGHNIVSLLQGTTNQDWDEATREASWAVLQRLFTQSTSGMDSIDLGLTLCQVALVGRHHGIPQERLDAVRDGLLRWGAPASFTFSAKDMAYGGRAYGMVSGSYGCIFVADSEQRSLAASHTDRITEQAPTVHVGDHWFAEVSKERFASRGQVEPLTEPQKQDYRTRFAALVEAAALTHTAGSGRRPNARQRLP